MATNILMPALSPTMTEGNLAKWHKQEGDSVEPGDILAEIETDKATMEVEAVDEGILAKILIPDGTASVSVNEVIGIIAAEGEVVSTAVTPVEEAESIVEEKSVAPEVLEVSEKPSIIECEFTKETIFCSGVRACGKFACIGAFVKDGY